MIRIKNCNNVRMSTFFNSCEEHRFALIITKLNHHSYDIYFSTYYLFILFYFIITFFKI